MKKYRVVISVPSACGDTATSEIFWFEEYDDAHRFYAKIVSLKGTPWHPSIKSPPSFEEFPIPKVYAKGEKTPWEKT